LQKFFLGWFKIKAIIKFDRQALDEPLIGSVISILEKNSEAQERDEMSN
jgi:hypothetical protein